MKQFGTLAVDTIKAVKFLVPSSIDFDGSVGGGDNFSIDHFKCYPVEMSGEASGSTASFQQVQVALADQFHNGLYDVKEPVALCAPVSINGEDVKDPDPYLTCYKVKRAKGGPRNKVVRGTGIHANNQFGPESLTARNERMMYVPSQISFSSSKDCLSCHENKQTLLGTGHDLSQLTDNPCELCHREHTFPPSGMEWNRPVSDFIYPMFTSETFDGDGAGLDENQLPRHRQANPMTKIVCHVTMKQ